MVERPTVVVVGAATRDVDAADPRGWRIGGTVTYAAFAAATFGVRVRALIGVDPESAAAEELELARAAGVAVHTVPLRDGPVFDNREMPGGRVQFADGRSEAMASSALPPDWRSADAAILGPVAGELGPDWAGAFEPATFVGLAAQGLTRRLEPGRPVERVALVRSPLVERADAILISAEDVVGADVSLATVIRPGQRLVVTHGDRGALFVRSTGDGLRGRHLPPAPRRDAVDTTGAGDVFLAAWIAARTTFAHRRRGAEADEWRALLVASAMASLSVERASLRDLPTRGDLCEVLVRLRDQRSFR